MDFKKHKDTFIDKIGMGMSTTCMFHCLLLPILLATVPFLSFMSFMKSPQVEVAMICFAIVNAVIAVCVSQKKHKRMIVPVLFISGTILLILNFIAHTFIPPNDVYVTIGAFLIGIGHFVNQKLCKSCSSCENTISDESKHRSI